MWVIVAVARQDLSRLSGNLKASVSVGHGFSGRTILRGERERDGSEEQFIPSILGERELCFRGAYISPRYMTSDRTPDFQVVEMSRDVFKPTRTTAHLNIALKGPVS